MSKEMHTKALAEDAYYSQEEKKAPSLIEEIWTARKENQKLKEEIQKLKAKEEKTCGNCKLRMFNRVLVKCSKCWRKHSMTLEDNWQPRGKDDDNMEM